MAAVVGLAAPVLGLAQDTKTPASAAKPEPGLCVTYTGGAHPAADTCVKPNVWLYVPQGKSPSPFLPDGSFTADWNGRLNVDADGDYAFGAELSGGLKVEINGETALEAVGTNLTSEPGKTVRLKQGVNVLKAHFTSPAEGDGFLRLIWKPKDSFFQPIPLEALTHAGDDADLKRAEKFHLGRELFAEYRCAKCHAGPGPEVAMPELTMDAPTFEGIGSRRNYEWMARWIQDPKALRHTAHMPKILRGPEAEKEAGAMAAYLASLKDDSSKPGAEPSAEQSDDGRTLFESLHCAACHNGPEATETDEKKVFLKQVREKFVPGALAVYLQKPDAHYAWIRMPNFRLTREEANQLAAYLDSSADKPKAVSAPIEPGVIEHGRKLVQTSGCLNCHALKSENQFSTRTLAELTPDKWKQGCLAAAPDSKAPWFDFTVEEREELQAFCGTDRTSLTKVVPAEFAERQTRLLNCRECHGKVDGIPAFDILGGRLKPEWAGAFIAGEIPYKPRPWLDARMPAFPREAGLIAEGLSTEHGYPPRTPAEPPVDMEAAKIGQRLVSAVGGLSCVSCHAVGQSGAPLASGSAGINLAYSGERLMRPFFDRWMRYPQLVDPTTKMPTYFDDQDKSALTTILDGTGPKQVNALWQYIRLGDKMPPPPSQ